MRTELDVQRIWLEMEKLLEEGKSVVLRSGHLLARKHLEFIEAFEADAQDPRAKLVGLFSRLGLVMAMLDAAQTGKLAAHGPPANDERDKQG